MKKIKIVLQRYGTEAEVATSIAVQPGDFVIIHAPEGYESNGKYMTAEVIAVSSEVGILEEKFVQKIETNYYDQMLQAKTEKSKMKAVLDKIWNDKSDEQKLDILSTTEPLIEEVLISEEPVAEPVVEETVEPETDETTPNESEGTT